MCGSKENAKSEQEVICVQNNDIDIEYHTCCCGSKKSGERLARVVRIAF